jgi:hypothetical protein
MAQKTVDQWQKLFSSIEKSFYVPTDSASNVQHVVVQSMVVDLNELAHNLKAKNPDWESLTVFADVIVLPDPGITDGSVELLGLSGANQKLRLCARCIQTSEKDGGIINSTVTDGSFELYAHEISGKGLRYSQIDLIHPVKEFPYHDLKLPERGLGISIQGLSGKPTVIAKLPNEWEREDSGFYWQMESAYNCAAALQGQQTELAQSMLAWVSRVTADSGKFFALNANSTQLHLQISQFNGSIDYVPVLTQSEYHEVTQSYMEAAKSFEDAFDKFSIALTNQSNQSKSATALFNLYQDKSEGSNELVQQVEKNLSDAQSALEKNLTRIKSYKNNELNKAMIDFRNGKLAFQEKKESQAIVGIVTSVFTVVASVGEMAMGDEAAAATAVEGAAKAATSLQKLAELIKKIAKMIKSITELLEKLKQVQEAVEKLVEAQKLGDELPSVTTPTNDGTFDNTYWEEFTITAKSVLTEYTTGENKIDGAKEYLKCLEILAVYGKAVYASQLSVVKYQQRKLQLTLDQLTNRHMKERLAKLVKEGEQDTDSFQKAKLFFYRRLVDVKSRIILLINDEVASYKYWAVTTTLPIRPATISEKVGDLYQTLGAISSAKVEKKTEMYPGPHPFQSTLSFRAKEQPELFECLKKGEPGSLVIPLTESHFSGLGRVRISDLHVYLDENVVADPSQEIRLIIETNGHYFDRYEQVLEFVSLPLFSYFRYKENDKNNPIFDFKSADRFKDAYFYPTPFTSWRIGIDSTNQAKLDLSKLETITFKITGSATPLPNHFL